MAPDVHAQSDLCNSAILTDKIVVTSFTRETLTFGTCYNSACAEQAPDLEMTVYVPTGMTAGIDQPALFPLMVLLPGGGFLKGDHEMAQWPEQFVKRGMIVATIDYRNGWDANGDGTIDDNDTGFDNPGACIGNESTLVRAVIRAAVDARTAVRFLLGDPVAYPIDKQAIFCGGPSAGAALAVHVGYGREGELESLWTDLFGPEEPLVHDPCDMRFAPLPCIPQDSAGYYQGHFSFRGVMVCWGGLIGLTTMDPHPGPDNGDTTPDSTGMIAFYGGYDNIFPPDTGSIYSCPDMTVGMGGLGMFNTRRQYGFPAQVYTDPSALHKYVWLNEALQPGPERTRDRLDRVQFIAARTACFFKSLLCNQPCGYDEPMVMEKTTDWANAYYNLFGTSQGEPVGCNNNGSTRFRTITDGILTYPNPTTNRVRIVGAGFKKGGRYDITDMMGKVVLSGTFRNEDQPIDMTSLDNGVYLVHLSDDTHESNARVVLQR